MATSNALMSVYNRLPVAFTHGEGIWLWDTNGKKYLDAIAGIGVCALGHVHPEVTKAIIEQAGKLIHTGNGCEVLEQQALAEELTTIAGMDNVFFCNSGAEANEAAIKLARLHGHQRGIDVPHIVVVEKSFHGRTLTTLSASGNRKIQAGYEPLVTGFIRAPFNDIKALQNIAEHDRSIVALMIEPILGNAGVILTDEGYLSAARKLCDEQGWLLILDEIQTGIGRTGSFFYYQQTNIKPDIVTAAKALAGGIPIGACLARGGSSHLFKPEKHGSTFGGSPFVSHVARTVLRVVQEQNLANNAQQVGQYLLTQLRNALAHTPGIVDIRGKGLMIGIELDRPCRDVLYKALSHGLLCNVTGERVIRLLPPLIINEKDADLLVERLALSIHEFYEQAV